MPTKQIYYMLILVQNHWCEYFFECKVNLEFLLIICSFFLIKDTVPYTNTVHKILMNWNCKRVIWCMFWKNVMMAGMLEPQNAPAVLAPSPATMLNEFEWWGKQNA